MVTLAWRDREKQGYVDLESLEIHTSATMHEVSSVMLEKLINSDGGGNRNTTLPCEHGHVFEFKEYRDKEVLTVLGSVTIRRAYYYDLIRKDLPDIEGALGHEAAVLTLGQSRYNPEHSQPRKKISSCGSGSS